MTHGSLFVMTWLILRLVSSTTTMQCLWGTIYRRDPVSVVKNLINANPDLIKQHERKQATDHNVKPESESVHEIELACISWINKHAGDEFHVQTHVLFWCNNLLTTLTRMFLLNYWHTCRAHTGDSLHAWLVSDAERKSAVPMNPHEAKAPDPGVNFCLANAKWLNTRTINTRPKGGPLRKAAVYKTDYFLLF